MAYIGNPIYQSAFVTDTFSGNGTTTAFTMSVAPAGTTNVLVAVSGVLQDPSTYGVVGTTLNFSAAPPSGTGNISVRYLGIPATGVTTTAYRTVTEFTATAGQTTFTPPSYTVGFIDVYRNGVLLGSADFTATNGTTIVLANPATAGDLVETISFLVSSVLNAIPNTAGSVSSSNIANDVTINFADGSASTPSITNNGDTNTGIFFPAADTIAFTEGGVEAARFDASGNLGIGTTNPSAYAKVASIASVGSTALYAGSATQGVYISNSTGNDVVYNSSGSNAGPHIWQTGNVERMRIAPGGSVGIGTNNPDKNLTVQSSAAETVFEITSTSTNGKAYDWISGGSGGNFAGGRFGLYSRTDAIELMAATSNTGGTAGGTTGRGVGFSHAGFWMDRGWADFPSMTVCSTSQTGNTNQSQIRMHGTNATWASYPNVSGSDFACSFYIDGTYQTSSDRRFKTNISTIDNALNKVMSMSGKRYQTLNRIGEIEPGFTENGFRYGFIAQELQSAGLDELYKHNVEEDDGTEGYNKAYAVDYDSVVPLLVNAIKELKAELDSVKTELVTLKGAL
jgi:hypothetical protein